jgi:hypothetical protein
VDTKEGKEEENRIDKESMERESEAKNFKVLEIWGMNMSVTEAQ